jgi:zinc D-Ala-D-Ala carboxypeptidase
MLFVQIMTRLRKIFSIVGLFVTVNLIWGTDPPESGPLKALALAALPSTITTSILARIEKTPESFQKNLSAVLEDRKADPMLLYRVDKSKALPVGYAPTDLVALDGSGLSVSRKGLLLRKPAVVALKAMNDAGLAEGLIILVSSSYRSYAYQQDVWNRGIAKDGKAETEASIARPGHSQHQLGTTIDFGSITDSFAQTKASRWLAANAYRFGFSLSFPKGMTETTGYKWESWHYRYIGIAAATLEKEYFGGIQQYLLLFLENL